MNKRGAEVLSIYWFAILVIVATGIVIMVNANYSHPYDVREIENEILTNNVADCISYRGRLNADLVNKEGIFNEDFKDNFLEKCHINFETEDSRWQDQDQFYIEVNFFDVNNPLAVQFQIEEGEKAWKTQCELEKEEEFQTLVKCLNERLYSTIGGKQYLVDIFTIVRKTEKNVKG